MIFLKLFLTILGVGFAFSLIIGLIVGFASFKDGWQDLVPKTSLISPAYVQVTNSPAHEDGGFIKVANSEPIAKEPAPKSEDSVSGDTLSADEQAQLDTTEADTDTTENLSEADMSKDLSPEDRAEYDKMMKELEAQGDMVTNDTETDMTKDKPKTAIEKALGPLGFLLAGVFGLLLGIAFLLLYLGVIFSFVAYIKSRVGNLVFNNTSIDHISFHSTQRMRDLLWIYVSNALVLMCTIGFATPWAQVRLAKYRAEHLAIVGETDWDKFIGEKKDAAKATGEEIADFFDVDLSFGF